MPKHTYRATAPNGQVFSRTTNREYAYAVTCKPNYAAELAKAEQSNPYDASNHAYICDRVARGDYRFLRKEEIEHYKQWASLTTKEYSEVRREERVAAVEARKADGYYDRYLLPSWSSRLDLAQREADKDRKRGRVDVVILDAVLKLSGGKRVIQPESSLHFNPRS